MARKINYLLSKRTKEVETMTAASTRNEIINDDSDVIMSDT